MGFLKKIAAAFRADTSSTLTLSQNSSTCILPGGFSNESSGLGVPGLDPSASLAYQSGRLLSAVAVDKLYTFDWLAQRVIEKMPSISLVRGIKGIDPDTLKEFNRLNFTERFPKGCYQTGVFDGRAYGGAVLLVGYKLGAPATPLTPAQAAGGLAFLDLFGQHELEILTRVDDERSPDYGMPELYRVIANTGLRGPHPRAGQIFHASRAIRFAGNPLRVPNSGLEVYDRTGSHAQPELGVSVLTPVMNMLGQYGLAWSAASNLLSDASIGWMKMDGLVEALASEDKSVIEDRMAVLQRTKAVHRMLWLDASAEEEYGRTETSLTDVPALLQQLMVAVAAAADMPASQFFSTSPAGLNANAKSDGDLTQLYNTAASYQRDYLGPKLNTLLTAVAGGEEQTVEWPSLWDSSENEKAQTRLAHANVDKVYWDMGFSADDIAKARKNGTVIELSGVAPEDDRDDVAGAGAEPPAGAPGKQQASKIATTQRAKEKK